MEPKRIDFEKNHFVCTNGEDKPRKYFFHDVLSVERYEVFEDLEMEVAQGRSFADVFNSQKKIHEFLNASKVADAAIENFNSMRMVQQKLEKRFHPAMRMVALFANEENEDITRYDDVVMEKKMNDWKAEGFAQKDFFHLAFNLVEDMLKNYEEISQLSLNLPGTDSAASTTSGEKGKSSGQS